MFVLRDVLCSAAFCTLASMSLFLIFFYIVWFVEFVRKLCKLRDNTDDN